jgi:hypothetical protein
MYKYLNVMKALPAFLPFSVRLRLQSGWLREAPQREHLIVELVKTSTIPPPS